MRKINGNSEDLLLLKDRHLREIVVRDHTVKAYHKKYVEQRTALRFHTQS